MPTSKVNTVNFLSEDVFELVLERDGVEFQPGNCFAISNSNGVSRPYSASSGTNEPYLRFDYLRGRCPFRLCVSREEASGHHHGRVTDLLSEIPRQERTDYYLCGLDAMIDEVSQYLQQHGVHFTRIHREVFFNA